MISTCWQTNSEPGGEFGAQEVEIRLDMNRGSDLDFMIGKIDRYVCYFSTYPSSTLN
jgi:hypothetical protein